jgi:hypothetical protein
MAGISRAPKAVDGSQREIGAIRYDSSGNWYGVPQKRRGRAPSAIERAMSMARAPSALVGTLEILILKKRTRRTRATRKNSQRTCDIE